MSAHYKRLLRRPEVEKQTGLRKSRIYELISAGAFPKPVAIGGRARGWVDAEVDAWIEARIAERDSQAA